MWYCDVYWVVYVGKGEYGGFYVVGDGVMRDVDGYIWILGCFDDVVNVLGYCLFMIEIEFVFVVYDIVGEVGLVGVFDLVMGQVVVVFVILFGCVEVVLFVLCVQVVVVIGFVVKFKYIVVVFDLFKICFGKIMW